MATTKINHPDLLELDSSTGATVFPKGTTAERPVSPEAGYIRFNTTDNVMETYDGTEWLTLDTLAPTYSIDYLVVAGGGGGGRSVGGGGGAGGLLTSTNYNLSETTQYTIIIGAGGVGTLSTGTPASTNGADSTFGNITAIGGGAGKRYDANDGGSGGGGGAQGLKGNGTLSQGFDGGNGYFTDINNVSAGGGGGSSSVGVSSTGGTVGKNGGNGTSINITGSYISYAGGGGGGGRTAGGLGQDGGGNGGQDQTDNATAASANTGSGGGGGGGYYSGQSGKQGGSGIVILRMPTANYSGTTTGSPTVTTDGSDTILTYTTSGTYTA